MRILSSITNNKDIASKEYVDNHGGGTPTDVQINGTSIVSNNTANIITNTAYNSSTNKIATMSDIPSILNGTISAGDGSVTIGNIGIEWGTVQITSGTSGTSSGGLTIYNGSTTKTFTNTYKYAPIVITSFNGRFANQISTAVISTSTTSVILALNLLTASSSRYVSYIVVGIVDD